METKSRYGVFINKKKQKKLVYYPCPKNANTSAKLFFLKHLGLETKFIFIGDKIPLFNQKKSDFKGLENLINFLPTKQPFAKIEADYKCCLVRDPLERFLSAFNNRILFHKDTAFRDHSIEMILEKLENNLFENRHFLPQNYFLGNNLNYFSFYADVKNKKIFVEKVNDFFEKTIEFPRLQIGGSKNNIELKKNQINRLKKIYEDDYKLLLN